MAGQFVDFAEVKRNTSIEKAATLLGLKLTRKGDSLRGECPGCKSGGPRALALSVSKNSYFCFADNKGGDVIACTAHVRGVSNREAALFLSGGSTFRKSPSPAKAEPGDRRDAQERLEHLVYDHEVLALLKLSPVTAEALDIGYCSKGFQNGRIAIPLYKRTGELVGYAGLATREDQAPLLLFHKSLEERCASKPEQESVEAMRADLPKDDPDALRKLFRVV